eukprot:gene3095-3928_t
MSNRVPPVNQNVFRPVVNKREEVPTTKIPALEDELRHKLAAMASFNETERALLLRAFRAVDVYQPKGLVNIQDFIQVCRSLGVSASRLGREEAHGFFLKYGTDKKGLLPYELFACAILESPSRALGLENRRAGAYKVGGDYTFKGRIKYFPCRKGVYTPTDWDGSLAVRSAKLPRQGLSLEFVYGYGGLNNTAPNLFYTDQGKVVYYTAAVGVVYDVTTHTQRFFHGHDDDIKCLAIHPGRRLVATGQVASTNGCPYLCIWDTHETTVDGETVLQGLRAQIPFPDQGECKMRGVIALQFSPDKRGSRLVAVTADNDHSIFVFDWEKQMPPTTGGRRNWPPFGQLVSHGAGGKGTPPQVYGIAWNPFSTNSDAKPSQLGEFVSYGVKHIKMWRCFNGLQGSQYYGVNGKPGIPEGGRFASCKGVAPQDVMSACFVPKPDGYGSILVTGTRTGELLLWSTDGALECKKVVVAHAPGNLITALSGGEKVLGGVRCLRLRDSRDILLSAGSDGRVIPWGVKQLCSKYPEKAIIQSEVVTLPNSYGDSSPPMFRSLDSKPHSPIYMGGTFRCDIWEVDKTPEPIIYGHAADVYGLAVHPEELTPFDLRWSVDCEEKPTWFVTASEAHRVFVWDSHKRCLLAKRNVRRPARSADFSPDGNFLAVGCKDGSFVVIQFSKEMEYLQRPDGTPVDIRHCVEAIDAIKFSSDGLRLAVGSHDNFVDIYDTTRSQYNRIARCQGHSSYITHIDWSKTDPRRPDYRVLQSTDGAYELLYFDGNTGQQVRTTPRDEPWQTYTCILGFNVMGIWPKSMPGEKAADGTDCNACARGAFNGEELLVTADDSGLVKLFNYPAVVEHAPFRAAAWGIDETGARKNTGFSIGYRGHSSHVMNIAFTVDGRRVVSVGGHDRAIFQWRVDAVAKEQRGPKPRTTYEAPVVIPPPKGALAADTTGAPEAEDAETPVTKEGEAARKDRATMSKEQAEAQRKKAATEAKAAAKLEALKAECDYEILVHTSNLKGAGTNANVFFSMYGEDEHKNTLAVSEFRLDNAKDNFERGMKDIFQYRANDIGTLTKCRIRHDNTGMSPGWHVAKVVVHNKTRAWDVELLPQDFWLDLKEPDAVIEKTLVPMGADGKPIGKIQKYMVCIITSDTKGAGTDANVFINLFGDSDSGRRRLDNSKNNFERGQRDEFEIEACIGKIQRVRIGHDNSGLAPGWHLQDVIVRAAGTPDITFNVPTGGVWLDDEEGVERDLYAVTVYTSDIKFAGTDANVSITIRGEKANSGVRKLSTSKDNFERGKVDTFFVEAPDVGKILAIEIGHDDKGAGAGWHLNKDDGAVKRLLYAMDSSEASYTVSVFTSDVKFAGTDADVCVTLYGKLDGKDTKSSSDIPLSTSKNNFERSAVDVFSLPPCPNLGDLTRIQIGHNNKGMGPGWHLAHVEVTNDATQETWYFPCDRWFDKDEPPNKISQVLPVVVRDPNATKCDYKVEVHTSDVKFAGTDANVHVTLFGSKGNSGKQALSNSKNNFERNMVDQFILKGLPNVGAIDRVLLGHDNSLPGAGWHVFQVEVFSINTGERVIFPVDRWFATDEEPYQCEQTLFPLKDGKVQGSLCDYQVNVHTSDIRFAGTDAEVSVTIFGTKDGQEVQTATKVLANSKNNFERNMKDEFMLKLVDVGELTKVQIGHNAAGAGADWHLSHVEVHNKTTDVRATFWCDRWIDKENGLQAILTAMRADTERCKYKVVTFTSDIRGAGTDANVTIKLLGPNLSSDLLALDNSKNNFERNMMDEFVVDCKNIGEVTRVEIGHDGKYPLSGWHLNKVIVTNLVTSGSAFFHHNKWLDSASGRRVMLNAGSAEDSEHQYQVTIHTGDLRGAGTDANVSIVVYGDKGDTGLRKLDNSANNFERAMVDHFHFSHANLGKVERIQLGHDNSGFGPGWYCQQVEVTDQSSGDVTSFPINKWFDRTMPPHQLTQTFFPGGSDVALVRYDIKTHTSDIRGAGTDSNVSIEVHGMKEGRKVVLGPSRIENSANNFERGRLDEFQVQGVDIGEVERAIVTTDGSGLGAAWHLMLVEVKHGGSSKNYLFNCNKWLDKSNKYTAELVVGGEASSRDHRYKVMRAHSASVESAAVVVHTSDLRGAGTDADVSMVLYGKKGDSGERKLDTSANNFERGMEDIFFFECQDLGELLKLRVAHNNKGFGPGWHLQDITVTNTSTSQSGLAQEAFFEANCWLDKSEPPYQISTELTPQGATRQASTAPVTYNITVYTTDKRGAGTDATVFVELHGDKGNVGWTRIENSKNNFERGAIDEFTITGSDVGKFTSLGVKHDNSGFGPGWHLQQIEVRSGSTGELGSFPCNNWLDRTEGDKKTERHLLVGVGEEGSAPVGPDQACRYKVEVFTGNVFGAGTDANVFLTLKGAKGLIKERKLDHGDGESFLTNKFERNKTDTFFFNGPVVADAAGGEWQLEECMIMMDNSGFGSDWHLDHLNVMNASEGCEMRFVCRDWLNKKQDFKVWRRDQVYSTEREKLELATGAEGKFQYQITFVTGNKLGAGTDAGVAVTLTNEEGEKWEPMLDQQKGNFSKGKSDTFVVTNDDDFGELESIGIKHDGKGLGDSWFLDKGCARHRANEPLSRPGCKQLHVLQVIDEGLTPEQIAQKQAAAQSQLADRLKEDENPVPKAPTPPPPRKVEYRITTETGDVMWGGTDAEVAITLVGETAERTWTPALAQDKASFERGKTAQFLVSREDEFGEVEAVRVTQSKSDKWKLEKVVVTEVESGREWQFPHHDWVKESVELTKARPSPALPTGRVFHGIITSQGVEDAESMDEEEYVLEFHTGNKTGAGTDALVSCQLVGEQATSKPLDMDQEKEEYVLEFHTGNKTGAGTDALEEYVLEFHTGNKTGAGTDAL